MSRCFLYLHSKLFLSGISRTYPPVFSVIFHVNINLNKKMSMEEINRIRKGMARNGFVIYALGGIDKMEKDGRYGISQAYRSSVK